MGTHESAKNLGIRSCPEGKVISRAAFGELVCTLSKLPRGREWGKP
jgi:hypothetical protein